MKIYLYTWILGIIISSLFTKVMAQTQTAENLMIVEIMNNPFSVSDDQGEWFELYNPTTEIIDLNGWIIADLDNDIDTIQSLQPILISPKSFFVLANQANLANNGGVIVNYSYDGNKFILANRSDEIILKNPAGKIIDEVTYNTIDFPVVNGSSMFFLGASTDNNQDGKQWQAAEKRYATSSDKGSPGTHDLLQVKLVNLSTAIDVSNQTTAAAKLPTAFFKSMNSFISPLIHLSNFPVTEYQEKVLGNYLLHANQEVEALMFNER